MYVICFANFSMEKELAFFDFPLVLEGDKW